MHLQTTLIVPNHDLQIKPNQRSQLLNFLHPLHVLKKINHQYLQKLQNEKHHTVTTKNILSQSPKQKSKVNFVTFQKKVNNFIPTQRKIQKKTTIFDKEQPIQNSRNIIREKERVSKADLQSASKISQNHHSQKFFNEDDGILEHLFNKFSTPANHLTKSSFNSLSSSKLNLNKVEGTFGSGKNDVKCFIVFGFQVSLLELHQFLSLHPQINLTVKLYKYEDSEFYKEIEITQGNEIDIEEKLNKLSNMMNERKIIDCEEITFVISLSKKETKSLKNQNEQEDKQQQKTEIGEFYFFPNINIESRQQESPRIRSEGMQNEPTQRLQSNSLHEKLTLSYSGSMGSLRKSHQNFRLLQVLEYYINLECHSQYMIISPSESLVIREFLSSIYEKQLRDFSIFINHNHEGNQSLQAQEHKQLHNATPTQRSIVPVEKQDHMNLLTPQHTQNYLSSCSSPKFISVNGQLIINDQFIAKLSSIKPPEPCTDSVQFRKQKQLMYHMKLEQYHEEKQLRKVKKEFTQTINYLNSLIGLQHVSYDEISLQSLKTIKNAKIKQSTSQLKELVNLSHEKEIRYQDLKSKIALYEKIKSENHQQNDQKISILRKEIIERQKQLNLHKNQLSNIYETGGKTQHQMSLSKLSISQLSLDCRVSIDDLNQEKSWKNKGNQAQKNKQKSIGKTNFSGKEQKFVRINVTQSEQKNSQINKQKPSTKMNLVSPSKRELKPNQTNHNLQSFLNTQLSASKGESSHSIRRSSHQLVNKYASILEQLRKQKYEDQLRQEKTKCQFQAEKEFQKLKEQYQKTTKDLLLILGDCD